jgi:hypothetical protein
MFVASVTATRMAFRRNSRPRAARAHLLPRSIFRLAAGTALLALAGCPQPVTLKTVTLSAAATDGLSGSYYSSFWQSWECDFPLPGQGFFLNGLGPATLPPGEVYSGWEDIYNQGAQPLPCEQAQQTLYRGHVMFDLSQFTAIADATLTWNVVQSESTTGGPSPIPALGYATTLGMSTGQINGSNGPYYWPYDNDVALPACNGALIQPNCSIDVSTQARLWATNQHSNYGFIIAGPILSSPGNLPHDNNAQLSWYGGFQLVVLYNPALNPNAPQ